MSETIDLSAFELDDTATMEVLTKKGDQMEWEGKPVSIEFYGPGSEKAQAWENKQAREQTARAMKMARGKTSDVDPHKDMTDRLVFMTKQIHNLPVTPAALFGNRKLLHVADQSVRFLGDMGNF
ncbi:MAG: hypothetical protein WC023_15845 [Rhodocyclaceae bacterium]